MWKNTGEGLRTIVIHRIDALCIAPLPAGEGEYTRICSWDFEMAWFCYSIHFVDEPLCHYHINPCLMCRIVVTNTTILEYAMEAFRPQSKQGLRSSPHECGERCFDIPPRII